MTLAPGRGRASTPTLNFLRKALLIALVPPVELHAADGATTVLAPIEVIGVAPLPGIGPSVDALPGNVQRFGSRDLSRSRDVTVSQFLDERANSVTTSGASGNPFQSDLTYRGFAASPLLGTPQGLSVFLDGVRINEVFGDVVNWDLLPMNALAQAALVPGSNPVYGLNTLGGALVLATRDGRAFGGSEADVSAGSFGRRALSVNHGGADGPVDWYVSGHALDEDGWREHSASRLRQAFGKLGYRGARTTAEMTLNAADNSLEGTQALPRSMLDEPRQAYTWPDVTKNRSRAATARLRHALTSSQEISVQSYWRNLHSSSRNSNVIAAVDEKFPASNVDSAVQSTAWGLLAQWSGSVATATGRHETVAGAAFDGGDTDFDQRNTPALLSADRSTIDAAPGVATVAARTRVRQAALYLLDVWSLGERTTITASARSQRASIEARDRSGLQPALDGDHTFARLNPSLGATYRAVDPLTLFASASQGMRTPTAMELTCADPHAPCSLPNIFVADPPLRPVVATTLEAGLRASFANGNRVSAALYRTRLRDDIQFIATGTSGASTGYFANVGATERAGAEVNAHLRASVAALDVRYAWTRAWFLDAYTAHSPANATADDSGNIVVTHGNHLAGVPEHVLKAQLDVRFAPAWDARFNVVAASRQYARGNENNADPAGHVGGYAVMNMNVLWRPHPSWELQLTIANVLDRSYQTFATLGTNLFGGPNGRYAPELAVNESFVGPAPPRAAWLSVRYSFASSR